MNYPLTSLLALGLAVGATHLPGATLFDEDYESYQSNTQPEASARVRPLGGNVGQTDPLPITGAGGGPIGVVVAPYTGSPIVNTVGTGNFARIYDYDSAVGLGLEYNFVDSADQQVSLLHFGFDFASTSPSLDTNGQFRISVGGYGGADKIMLSSGANRPFMLNIYNNGDFRLSMADATSVSGTYDVTQAHHVDVFLNDYDSETYTLTGYGDPVELYTNSVTVYLDGTFFGQAMFDNTLNYLLTPNNFGRVGFFTTTATVDVDFLLDNVVVDTLDLTPDPTPVPWPGGGSVEGSEGTDYDTVLVDDAFADVAGPLYRVSRWSLLSGDAGAAVTATQTLDLSTSAGPGRVTLPFWDGVQVKRSPSAGLVGPRVYVRFDVKVDGDLTSTPEPLLGLQNPTLSDRVVAMLWVRAGDSAGTAQFGTSPTDATDDIQWAPTQVSAGDFHTVVFRQSLGTNDRAIWIDPADASATPDIVVAAADDTSDSAVSGVTLIDSGVGIPLELDNLRACGSLAKALDRTPVDRPALSVAAGGTPGTYAIDATGYSAAFEGNMQIDSISVGGESFLYHGGSVAGGRWVAAHEGAVGNSSMLGDQYFAIQTNYQFSTCSGRTDGFTLLLQNNDQASDSTYELLIPADIVDHVVGDSGTVDLTGTSAGSPASSSAFAIVTPYASLQLRGDLRAYKTTVDSMDMVAIDLPIPARAVRELDVYAGTAAVYAPMNYEVYQRDSETSGPVHLAGATTLDADSVQVAVSAVGGDALAGSPFTLTINAGGEFADDVRLPAGGWYEATFTFMKGDAAVGTASVAHFGVGEVFIGAGQSNSTNNGTEPQTPTSDLVVSFSGGHWQPAVDPQPGVHDISHKGSYYPAFLDGMAAQLGVPVAIASTGHGGTDVVKWLPDYAYNYDTYASYARYNGLYTWTEFRINQFGKGGFRAVLWHQGESDSTHTAGVTRTSEDDYYNRLKTVIESSRADAGWDVPWFVAQVSVWPLDNPAGDPNISAAQQRIWADGIAMEGADTDALGLEYRQTDGSKVHFNPSGLTAHGQLWIDIVQPWVQGQLDNDTGVRNAFGADVERGAGNDWYRTGDFGWFWAGSYPWAWNADWGWIYAAPATSGWWMYPLDSGDTLGWLWTDGATYPALYSAQLGWIYRDDTGAILVWDGSQWQPM